MKPKTLIVLLGVAMAVLGCHHVAPAARQPIYFTCPMHPSVKVAAAGNCPLCEMKLVPAFAETDSGTAGPCGAANCAAPGKNSPR